MRCYGYCSLEHVVELPTSENQNLRHYLQFKTNFILFTLVVKKNLHFRPLAPGLSSRDVYIGLAGIEGQRSSGPFPVPLAQYLWSVIV